jgi:hypothetical protein
MVRFSTEKVLPLALLVGAGLMLGGCGSTTYGTGTTAAAQTVKDVTGILSLGGSKSNEPPIEYEPRASIVEPPVVSLPPPGSETPVATAANWPVDPDEEKKRIDALVQERTEAGQSLKFTVPESSSDRPVLRDDQTAVERALKDTKNRQSNPELKKVFADAKQAKIGSFDEQGNPTRRYLIEPPAEYREPDPESPVEITEKPKKKKGFNWPDLWPF